MDTGTQPRPLAELSPEDEALLRGIQGELCGAQRSPWQPRAISHAFARREHMAEARPRLTMQGWIDLEAEESPYLIGAIPTLEDLLIALRALGWSGELAELMDARATDDRVLELNQWVRMAMEESRSTLIRMEPADGGRMGRDDGFGDWGPIMACLLNELNFELEGALGVERSKALALVACRRRNQGWHVSGEDYRTREMRRAEGSRSSNGGNA